MRFSYYKIVPFSRYSRWNIGRYGKREGKVATSQKVDENCYENILRKLGPPNLERHEREWRKLDSDLEKKHKKTHKKVENLKPLVQKAHDKFEQDRINFEKLDSKGVLNEKYNIPSASVYFGILLLVAIVEMPFNLIALRVFGEAEIYIMALALVFGIAYAAALHSIAVMFGERPFEEGFIQAFKKHPIGAGLLFTLPFVIIGFSFMRKTYVEGFQTTLNQYGVASNVDPNMLAVVLGIILLFISLLAIERGARRHDPDVKKADDALKKASENFKASEKKLETLNKQLETAQHSLIEIETERQHLLSSYRSEAKQYKAFLDELIAIYRNAYTRAWRKKNPNDGEPNFVNERLPDMQVRIPESIPSFSSAKINNTSVTI